MCLTIWYQITKKMRPEFQQQLPNGLMNWKEQKTLHKNSLSTTYIPRNKTCVLYQLFVDCQGFVYLMSWWKKFFIDLLVLFEIVLCWFKLHMCLYFVSYPISCPQPILWNSMSCTDVQISNVTQQSQLNILLMKSVSNFDSRWQYNLESGKDNHTTM